MKHEEITEALKELGYNSNWILSGNNIDDIKYLDDTLPKPTKTEIINMIEELPQLRIEREALKVSAYQKLGLSDDEINAIIGVQ
jgi:hypothetical protein